MLEVPLGQAPEWVAAIFFEYVGQQGGWNVSVEHFDLVPCNCGDCGCRRQGRLCGVRGGSGAACNSVVRESIRKVG